MRTKVQKAQKGLKGTELEKQHMLLAMPNTHHVS
jgi:hypothetical protein